MFTNSSLTACCCYLYNEFLRFFPENTTVTCHTTKQQSKTLQDMRKTAESEIILCGFIMSDRFHFTHIINLTQVNTIVWFKCSLSLTLLHFKDSQAKKVEKYTFKSFMMKKWQTLFGSRFSNNRIFYVSCCVSLWNECVWCLDCWSD